MTSRFSLLTVGLVALLLRAVPAGAAADPDFKESRLQHVCKGGATDGAICCAPTECGDGKCVVDSTGKVQAVLTLIVDNDVTNLDGSRIAGTQVHSLTTILELRGKTGAVLAQTFQHLDATDLQTLLLGLSDGPTDEFGLTITEDQLKQVVDPTGTGIPLDASFLIWRTLDPETVKQMRTDAGLAPDGPELLVVQPSKLKLQKFAPHVAGSPDTDPFATVVRTKMLGFFVAPKPATCP